MKKKLLKAVVYYDDGTIYEIEGEGAAQWQDALAQLGSLRIDGTKIDWKEIEAEEQS